jgi:hypothetical protein
MLAAWISVAAEKTNDFRALGFLKKNLLAHIK